MNIKVENDAKLDYLKYYLVDVKNKLKYYIMIQSDIDYKYETQLKKYDKEYFDVKIVYNILTIIVLCFTYNISLLIPIMYNLIMNVHFKRKYDKLKKECNKEYIYENNKNNKTISSLKKQKNNLEEQVKLRNFLSDILNDNSLELIDDAIISLSNNSKMLEIEELEYLKNYINNEKNYIERQKIKTQR